MSNPCEHCGVFVPPGMLGHACSAAPAEPSDPVTKLGCLSELPLVTPEFLRELADLVEQEEVSVIRCDLRPRGVILGIVEPRKPEET